MYAPVVVSMSQPVTRVRPCKLRTLPSSTFSEQAQALVILEVPVTIPLRQRIAELAALHGKPTMFWGGASDAGGVFAYGTSFTDTFAGVPGAIDQILKGAKPADMPFQVITRREFVINLKTARALGLTVPSELLNRSDRVID
jgi:putative ABC transport system substrate-binding protein